MFFSLNLAISFNNSSTFIIKDGGRIALTTELIDQESSFTYLNNVNFKTQGNFNTDGKFHLQSVVFEGVKYFANTSEVTMANGDYKFDYFSHNKVNLANTHVTTNLYDGKEVHCQGGSTGIHQY